MSKNLRKSYLDSIEQRENRLDSARERLMADKRFYQNCFRFGASSSILDRIAKLISQHEGEEYITNQFSFTVPGHYETCYRSPFEGLPNVSGAELAASMESYQSWQKEVTESKTVIVRKSTAEMFNQLSFSNMRDYFQSLKSVLQNQVHFYVPAVLQPDNFDGDLDYVNEYLSRLVDWRLENKTLTIPEEVLEALLNLPDTSMEMKLTMTNPNQPEED